MLHSISQLYGHKLGTSEGEFGQIKDFYFDDVTWAVRYIIVDTGDWLSRRQVLISPHAFGPFYQDGGAMYVDLTKEQIANSPSLEEHKPVSRQFEEEYYRYYGWPSYWNTPGRKGTDTGFPAAPPRPHDANDDPDLRSTRSLAAYHLRATDGQIGQVQDFIFDDERWNISHLVVATGHWFSSKEIVLPVKNISRICYDDSTIFVNVGMETVRHAPEYQPPRPAFHDTKNFDG